MTLREAKYDLIVDGDLVYPPVHESTIREVNPGLLEGACHEN